MTVTIDSIRKLSHSFTFDRNAVKQKPAGQIITIRVTHGDGSIEKIKLDPDKLHKIFKEAYLNAKKIKL